MKVMGPVATISNFQKAGLTYVGKRWRPALSRWEAQDISTHDWQLLKKFWDRGDEIKSERQVTKKNAAW